MIERVHLRQLGGRHVKSQRGEGIGKIIDVYESVDGTGGSFATVATGVVGGRVCFFPLAEAQLQGDTVVVPYSKSVIRSAPKVANDEELTAPEEHALAEYYQQWTPPQEQEPASSDEHSSPGRPKIFIVHGRDEGRKEAVARLVETAAGADAVILHELAWRGDTVVEKFERAALDAHFVVVIASGDDEGRLLQAQAELRPRARQNVILELGYFIGKLGRDRVAVLLEAGLELPSDIMGVGYIELDAGGSWRYQLAQELDAAGLAIEWRRVRT